MSLIRARYRAVNTIMNLPRGGGYVGLLDLYPNAAAAYSLRKLRAAYSGSAVRVRKEVSLVSSETDIGFLADGSLDTTSLLAFASDADSGNVFVVTWYDQALSNDATQSTATAQPKIVSGGSLVTLDGYACLDGDLGAGDTMLQASNVIDSVGDVAIFSTYALKTDGAAANQITFEIGNGTSTHRIHDTLGRDAAGTFGIDIRGAINYDFGNATGVAVDDIYLNSILSEANGFYINGTQQTSDNAVRSGSLVDALTLFNRGTGSFPYKGKFFEFIFFASDQSSNRTGIEANINTFYAVYPDFSVSGLLHDYPNAAAAYSVRQLTIYNNGYKEKLIRIRRSSGGETDVFADDSYELSLNSRVSAGGTLGNWIGSDDGFVSAWYDQSTNGNDATQSTAANQPKIVSGGSLVTENGKPAIDFDGVSSSFNVSKITLSDDWNLFITHKLDSNSYYFGDTIGGDYLRYRINDSYRLKIAGGTDTVTGIGDISGAQKLLNIERDSSNNLEYYLNGTSAATSSISGAWNIDEIGASVTNHFDGTFQELIIFNSDQSSNRTGIETNINTFYSVYP